MGCITSNDQVINGSIVFIIRIIIGDSELLRGQGLGGDGRHEDLNIQNFQKQIQVLTSTDPVRGGSRRTMWTHQAREHEAELQWVVCRLSQLGTNPSDHPAPCLWVCVDLHKVGLAVDPAGRT